MINNELIEGATDSLTYTLGTNITGSRFKIMYDEGSKIGIMNGWITPSSSISFNDIIITLSKRNKQPNPYYFTIYDENFNFVGLAELRSNKSEISTNVALSANKNYTIQGSFVLN